MTLDSFVYQCNQAEAAWQDYRFAVVAWQAADESWRLHRTGDAYDRLLSSRERRFHAWYVFCYWTGRSHATGAL